MQGNDIGLLRSRVFGKGLSVVLIFGFLLLSFVIFRQFLLRNRINTSPVGKQSANETSKTAYATGGDKPQCISLAANPVKGGARLLVTFITEGSAVNGVVKNFEFTFGDGKVETIPGVETKGISTATTTYTYEKPGTYFAAVRVQDVFDNWSEPVDNCKQTIVVEGQVLGE